MNTARNASGTYSRPAKSKATAVGDPKRRRYHRHLRSLVFDLIPPMEWLNAEDGAVNSVRRFAWSDRPAWAVLRVRIDHIALIDLLQRRHLQGTGKEISRAEVLAALMAAGLPRVLQHPDFSEDPKTKATRDAAKAALAELA